MKIEIVTIAEEFRLYSLKVKSNDETLKFNFNFQSSDIEKLETFIKKIEIDLNNGKIDDENEEINFTYELFSTLMTKGNMREFLAKAKEIKKMIKE